MQAHLLHRPPVSPLGLLNVLPMIDCAVKPASPAWPLQKPSQPCSPCWRTMSCGGDGSNASPLLVWPHGPTFGSSAELQNCFWPCEHQLHHPLLPVWLLRCLASVSSEAVQLCIRSGIGQGACKYVNACAAHARRPGTRCSVAALQRSSLFFPTGGRSRGWLSELPLSGRRA